MKKPHAPMVRELLLKHPDGLSTKEITAITGIEGKTLINVLKGMPDVYVDRWGTPNRGQYVAVWCIVTVPKDCPHPRRAVAKVETQWRT